MSTAGFITGSSGAAETASPRWKLAAFPSGQFMRWASLCFCAGWLASCAAEEPLYKGKPARYWVKQLRDRDAETRRDAARALGKIGTGEGGSIEALVIALGDRDYEFGVSGVASGALAEIGVKAVPALSQALASEKGRVRDLAADALGKIGPEARSAVPKLLGLVNGQDSEAFNSAVYALGAIGPGARAALPALKEALKEAQDDDSTTVINNALAAIEGPEAEPSKEESE